MESSLPWEYRRKLLVRYRPPLIQLHLDYCSTCVPSLSSVTWTLVPHHPRGRRTFTSFLLDAHRTYVAQHPSVVPDCAE